MISHGESNRERHYYAEIIVGGRVVHRFPCLCQEQADWLARRFIVDLFPEEETVASAWDFNWAAYWATNDLGESVMINATCYREKRSCGTYVLGGTA